MTQLRIKYDKEWLGSENGKDYLPVLNPEIMKDMAFYNQGFRFKSEEMIWPGTFSHDYCDQCDGCGWYEGGPTIKTTCEHCKGAGSKGYILSLPVSNGAHSFTEGADVPDSKPATDAAKEENNWIDKIKVDKANFEHIANTGKINGSLLHDLEKIGTAHNKEIKDFQYVVVEYIKLKDSLIEENASLKQQIEKLESKLGMSMGVGDGTGQLFVYGEYEAIKEAQKKLLRLEKLEAENKTNLDMLNESITTLGRWQTQYWSLQASLKELIPIAYGHYNNCDFDPSMKRVIDRTKALIQPKEQPQDDKPDEI